MKKTYKIFGLVILLLIIFTIKVNAASATLSVNKSSVEVGDTVTATVKYTAAAWNLNVTADSGLTTSSTTKYADSSESADNVTKSFTVAYKATKAGSFSIKLSGDVTDESSSTATSVSSSKTITVKEKSTTNNEAASNNNNTTSATKSSNAYLSTLGVTPKEYDFSGFSKTKTSYSVTVPSTVDSLKVVYKTADSKATVKVSGNSGFEVGSNNTIKLVVTAEDGKTTKTYQIKVTKLATEEEKPGNLIEETNKICLESLEIEGVNLSPEFSSDVYAYTANLETDLKEVKVNGTANNEKARIEVTGNTNLTDGENLINVVVISEDGATKVVYQITLNKSLNTIETKNEENGNNSLNLGKKAVKIIIIVIVTIILLIIIISILLIGENKRLKQLDEEDLFKSDYNNEIKNLNEIPRTEDDKKNNKRGGKHF